MTVQWAPRGHRGFLGKSPTAHGPPLNDSLPHSCYSNPYAAPRTTRAHLLAVRREPRKRLLLLGEAVEQDGALGDAAVLTAREHVEQRRLARACR